jgi:hypothetical protein
MKNKSPRVFSGNCSTPKCVGTPLIYHNEVSPLKNTQNLRIRYPQILGGGDVTMVSLYTRYE